MSSIHPLRAHQSDLPAGVLGVLMMWVGLGCDSTPVDPELEGMWQAFDASDTPFPVHSLHVTGDRLLASGRDRVMEWTGSEWVHVWAGRNPEHVRALAVFGGALVMGGQMPVWEPNTIRPYSLCEVTGPYSEQILAGGVDGDVEAVVVYLGELVVGGNFFNAAEDSIPFLARWDGMQWRSLGRGVDGPVRSLAADGDRLLVAGRFTRAGSEAVGGIARWNGTEWTSLGFDLDGRIEIATAHHGTVVVTGWFKRAGGPPRFEVARWRDAGWEPVGTPEPSLTANIPCFHDGRLYLGDQAGVRYWQPSGWERNSWTPRPVYALVSYRGALIAGGRGWMPQLGQWVPNVLRIAGP